jgi:threonyl-tRNA synthetase
MSEKIFEVSGHLENFAEGMFGAIDVDGARYRPKPMNCPGHIAIYQSQQRSYRDLPIRLAEFGAVYRYERSGVLHGMLRVRGFTQDDAHVFCTPEQVPGEIERLLDLVDEMLKTFGYPYTIELATKPEKALGTESEWANAEKVLADTLSSRGIPFEVDHGGGAFYGPKLDFKLIDAIGRKWQGPTVQLDFNLPERFQIEYIGDDNARHRPFMLHRVLVGSMERFVGGLIEHYGGAFPTWLAPEQVRVLPVSEQWEESARAFANELQDAGVRVTVVADVYAAGEAPLEGVSRDALVAGLRRYGHRRVLPLETPAALAGLIREEARSGDLVVCLGAGDITSWAYALPDELQALADART